MKNLNNLNNYKKEKRERGVLTALVYIIVIITAAMIFPLVYKVADDYSNSSRISSAGNNEPAGENIINRKYTVSETNVDISVLNNTEFGTLDLITAKVSNGGDIIMFCSWQAPVKIPVATDNTEATEAATETEGAEREETEKAEETEETVTYEDVLRIASINATGDISVFRSPIRYDFLESVKNKNYTFKDYGDGTFFISNSNRALLFNENNMRITADYIYPQGYNIYQSSLSNKKDMLALATEQGFFVCDLTSHSFIVSSMLSSANMKEIIAARTDNGVTLSARHPVWASDDEHIFYKLYADNFVRNAGVTPPSPGGNEQLTALECSNFLFLNSDSVFYYFLSNNEKSTGNMFRCGYFNIKEKKMTDVMRSQVYYFGIDVSSNGTHLAALSYNGNMIKISIIDIRTKKLIYSLLYGEIYDFSFSPDEKNVIIYGRTDNEKTLKVINIDWTEG